MSIHSWMCFFFSSIRVSSWPFGLLKTFSAATSAANQQLVWISDSVIRLSPKNVFVFGYQAIFVLPYCCNVRTLSPLLTLLEKDPTPHPALEIAILLKELCLLCPLPLMLLLNSVYKFCSCCSLHGSMDSTRYHPLVLAVSRSTSVFSHQLMCVDVCHFPPA